MESTLSEGKEEYKMRILVDADACPVKDIIVDVATKEKINVLMVASISHHIEADRGVVVHQVDNLPQAADMAITNRVKLGDIVVTQDYGLASLVLGKKAFVISPKGIIFNDNNIDSFLMQRHLHQKMRQARVHLKGVKARTKEDDQRFLNNFKYLIVKVRDKVQE